MADYPDGYFGKRDRDMDGIPCDNVSSSTKQVNALLKAYATSEKENKSNKNN
jgi:hypothetical protein